MSIQTISFAIMITSLLLLTISVMYSNKSYNLELEMPFIQSSAYYFLFFIYPPFSKIQNSEEIVLTKDVEPSSYLIQFTILPADRVDLDFELKVQAYITGAVLNFSQMKPHFTNLLTNLFTETWHCVFHIVTNKEISLFPVAGLKSAMCKAFFSQIQK